MDYFITLYSRHKAKISLTQQKSKFRLCGEKDEIINHLVSECSKVAKLVGESDSLGIVQEILVPNTT